MSDESQIYSILDRRKIQVKRPLVWGDPAGRVVFAFLKRDDSVSPNVPITQTALKAATRELRELGYEIQFISAGRPEAHIDTDYKVMLMITYPDEIRNSFVSLETGGANIWIEPKVLLSKELETSVRAKTFNFFQHLKIEIKSIQITTNNRIPTDTFLLKTLREISPASLESIKDSLDQRSFSVPNETWLNHTLDRLRKKGLVVRKRSGQYFLSYRALSKLGTSKDRNSPDVRRALALTRRNA